MVLLIFFTATDQYDATFIGTIPLGVIPEGNLSFSVLLTDNFDNSILYTSSMLNALGFINRSYYPASTTLVTSVTVSTNGILVYYFYIIYFDFYIYFYSYF